MKSLKNCLFLVICCALFSCGYFSDDAVEQAGTYRSEKLANSCQLNVDELAMILEKDVENQINCLEENLVNFTKYVKRRDQGTVSGNELGSFVRRFFKGHASVIIDSMGLIFDINALFLRDSRGSIATENIKPLFNLLRVANKRLSNMMETINFFEGDKIQIETAQMLIEKDLSEFSENVKRIITENGAGAETSINLREFFEKVKDRFSGIDLEEETLNGLLAFKKLYLGGDREVLTRAQLFLLLDRIPQLGGVAFSLLYSSEKNIGGSKNLYMLFKRNVEVLNSHLYPHRREEIIFKEGEVEGLIRTFFKEDGELYVDIAKNAKKNLLGSNSSEGPYSYKELRNVSFLTLGVLEGLIFLEDYRESVDGQKNLDRNNWDWKRSQFLKSFDQFKNYVIHSLDENIYFPDKVKVFDFADFIAEKFEELPFDKKILTVAPLLKVVIVGGPSHSISKLELLNIMEKSTDLTEIFFDLGFSSNETHDTQGMRGLYYQTVKKLRLILTNQKYLHISTVEDLVNRASEFMKKESLKTYLPTAEVLKEKFLGGYASSVSVADISKALEMAESFLAKYYYFDLSYDAHKDQLDSPEKIRYLNYRHHSDFKYFTREQILDFKKEFTDLVLKFRIYRKEDGTQAYTNHFERTKEGLLQIYMIKFFAEELSKAFGHKLLDKDTYGVTIEELNKVLFTFKPVLEDFGMWSKYPENFARNVILLADLFQGQSDGNLSMDPSEAAEYGTLALFAIQAAGEIVEVIKKDCEWIEAKEVEGFNLSCYRNVFFKALLEDLNLKERLPKLNAYIEGASDKEVRDFLVSVEGFARESRDQNRPETKKDLVLLIGAMLNIESTFLRYDTNKNNIVDPDELLKAFPVYEDAIMVVAPLEESQRSYAKSIFLYMIKYMEKPSKLQLAAFHYNPFRSGEISSKRLNIGALLYNMVLAAAESASAAGNASAAESQ